jgi:hypothetical protein
VLNLLSCVLQVILSPDTRILINAYLGGRYNETIDIYYSDSGVTNNTNFSFVTRTSIPCRMGLKEPELAFSGNGSKFAMGMSSGRVYAGDIQRKFPFKTFMELPKSNNPDWPVRHLQFSSGNVGREALVFVQVRLMFTF